MKLSKMFYADSLSYYKAASVLTGSQDRDIDEQLLLTPILFLLRHSIELITKALIIKLNEDSNDSFDITKYTPIFEDGTPSRKKLLEIHSVQELFSFIKYEDKNDRLASLFDDKEISFANKVIKDINSIDSKSDYFRYPIGKKKQEYKRHFISRSEDDVAPDIKNCYFLFLFGGPATDKCIYFKANEKYIKLAKAMATLIEIFINKF